MNAILRRLGIKWHKWEYTHRSGGNRTCFHCGEQQIQYMWWVKGWDCKWWETSKDGDGKCNVKPLPIRVC